MKKTCELKFVGGRKCLVASIFCLCFLANSLLAITYTSDKDGNWNSNGTWDSNGTPRNPLESGDIVRIKHNIRIISVNITVGSGSTISIDPGKRLEIHQAHSLTINSGGTVFLQANSNLQVEGVLNINGALYLNNGNGFGTGVLSGDGTVNGTFTNNGIVAPGIVGGQIKCLTFNDPYNNSGNTLQIQLNGTTACSGHDKVIVNDPITLSGTLNVSLVPGFIPVIGNSFTIMSSTGAVTGTFSSTILPVYPGVSFTVQYNVNSVVINTQASAPLPIELKSFTATPLRNNVQLDWSTASEKDNAGFDIERSADGHAWKTLGFVEGAGTTTLEQHYHFIDEKPMVGTSYYRLRQLDFGGKEEFSPVVAVEFKGDAPSVSVYPNPVADLLHVALDQSGTVEVMDGNGRILERIYAQENQPLTELNVSHYPSGIFLLRVVIGNSVETFSFVKH